MRNASSVFVALVWFMIWAFFAVVSVLTAAGFLASGEPVQHRNRVISAEWAAAWMFAVTLIAVANCIGSLYFCITGKKPWFFFGPFRY